ncbi:hypothetical protein DSO57_1035099 [Entomophthora muscae]|uniref:Uncharacterized protein n=1 Tax=Entomophthora muscae TaxID=34485 RepID=A0ACC2RQM3_9FUNG|nr:hypothetical protein DSO57_1035099 [Entomophthora muscae]
MVILTVLSLAKVVVPHLGAYHPIAADMLYLSHSLPFLYLTLVSCYPKGSEPFMASWYYTTPSPDNSFENYNLVLQKALLAQSGGHETFNLRVAGSSPVQSSAAIAQLGERQTEDLKVPRSIRGGRIFFFILFSITL